MSTSLTVNSVRSLRAQGKTLVTIASAMAILTACAPQTSQPQNSLYGEAQTSTTRSGSIGSLPGSLPSIQAPKVRVRNPLVIGEESTNVVDRGLYQAIVAKEGDTMQSLAARAGVSVDAFAAHNGLPTSYVPRVGQEFAIPSNGATVVSSPDAAAQAAATPETSSIGNEAPTGNTSTHRVKAGETAYSIARLYGVSVTSLATWNKLDGNLSVREGQELIIPLNETPNSTAPTQTASTAPAAPVSTSASGGFSAPVSGSVSTGYDPASNSDGYIYSTASQAPVRAASAGEVVLISQSTGANGTIVMVKHPNGLISVYGKMGQVSVTKGQQVSAGQQLGTTSGSELLFQLRQGTSSVDPAGYI